MRLFEFKVDSNFLNYCIVSPNGEEAYNLPDAVRLINTYFLDINYPLSQHSFKLNELKNPPSAISPSGEEVNNLSDLTYLINDHLMKTIPIFFS